MLAVQKGLVARFSLSIKIECQRNKQHANATKNVKWAITVGVFHQQTANEGLDSDADDTDKSLKTRNVTTVLWRGKCIHEIERAGEETRHAESQEDQTDVKEVAIDMGNEVD